MTTTESFTSRPEATHTYPYRRRNTVLDTLSDRRVVKSPGELTRVRGKERNEYFSKDGVCIQEFVDRIHGPVVEIAGPTGEGYTLLDGVQLPTSPLITNASTERAFTLDKSGNLDFNVRLDALLDARRLPFADESLGMVVVSCLIKVDESAGDLNKYGQGSTEVKRAIHELIGDVEHTDLNSVRMKELANISPRIGLWLEAERTLSRNGLFMVRGQSEYDVVMAQKLGFELVAHTVSDNRRLLKRLSKPHDWLPYEAMYMKSRACIRELGSAAIK